MAEPRICVFRDPQLFFVTLECSALHQILISNPPLKLRDLHRKAGGKIVRARGGR